MTAVVQPRRDLLAGAALIGAGMGVVGFGDSFIPLIAAQSHVWQFHLIRGAMALALIGLVLWGAGRLGAARPKRFRAVALRSVVVTASMLLYYASLPMIPIAEVAAGLATSPIWVLALSAALFREPVGRVRLGAIALGFSGAMLILRPDASGVEPGALLALGAGALYGTSILVTRRWCREEPTEAIVVGNFVMYALSGAVGSAALAGLGSPSALAGAAPFLFAPWGAVTPTLIGLIALNAAGAIAGIFLVTRGYQRTESSAAALFDYAFLISASFWGWALWGQSLDAQALLGAAMIVAAGAVIATAAPAR
jgi:drug/metabolite transporter (DMT)-like permease